MKAEIVAIGTEILLGEIADTNSSFIAAELPKLGIDNYWISSVGDNRERMLEVLERAWNRSDLIFTTGGLGPSEGDITRSTMAFLVGEELTLDPGVVENLRARFARLGRPMSQSNIKQAGIIPSAKLIPNARGTAPGWWLEKNGKILIAMPGPPAEMRGMWEKEIWPRLTKLPTGSVLISRTIKLWGISESLVNDMFLPLYSSANPTLAIYAKADGIYIRIAAKASDESTAREMITPIEKKITAELGDAMWGLDNDTLEDVAAKLFATKQLSLAVVEGFTGGLLMNTIADCPGNVPYFKGGIVANSLKMLEETGITPGIAENPEALADAVKKRFNADIGISVTGIPSEIPPTGTSSSPVEVGISCNGVTKRVTLNAVRERARAKVWVVSASLFELVNLLRGIK